MAEIERNSQSVQSPADGFDLEHFLPYRLSQLSNTVSQGIAQFYQQQHGLTVPEWRVMVVLGRYPGLTASQVCERTVMDKVTVSRAVKLLLDKQYLQRLNDSSDRRRRPLRVTADRGKKVLDDVIPFALGYQHALLRSLSPDDFTTLETLMEKLLAAATQLNQRSSPGAVDRS